MKKHLILVILFAFTCSLKAQVVRGLRIGYIDMEYILQNVPDYTEAKNQLEQKAQKWKQEISAKTNEVTKLKESLKTERVLLTKELIEEREEEISFQENEIMLLQEKRFGPNGELIVQKAVLIKPIQDQVFTAVQDIAAQRRYDFVFDKSSDLTMIFAAKQFDISDIIVRKLGRSSKRGQLSKKELKEEANKEYIEDVQDANSDYAIRKEALDKKKTARDSILNIRKANQIKILEDRKAAADAKRADAALKRQQTLEKRNGVTPSKNPATKPEEKDAPTENANKSAAGETPKKETEKVNDRQEIIDAKKKDMDDRRKVLADKRAKILEDRKNAKKPKETTPPATPTE